MIVFKVERHAEDLWEFFAVEDGQSYRLAILASREDALAFADRYIREHGYQLRGAVESFSTATVK